MSCRALIVAASLPSAISAPVVEAPDDTSTERGDYICRIAVSLLLKKGENYTDWAYFSPMSTLLSDSEINARMEKLPGWSRHGSEIRAEFKFRDFAGAIKFVNAVAEKAEAANHHPDIDIRWNTVSLVLSTHSAGGLTKADFDLAEKLKPNLP